MNEREYIVFYETDKLSAMIRDLLVSRKDMKPYSDNRKRIDGVIEQLKAIKERKPLSTFFAGISTISPEPGDIVLVSVSDDTGVEQMRQCREALHRQMKSMQGVQFIVARRTCNLKLISPEYMAQFGWYRDDDPHLSFEQKKIRQKRAQAQSRELAEAI